ncbi:MAG: hypothetical protein WBP81_21265 [Solirubrobacteraceae bacterium]
MDIDAGGAHLHEASPKNANPAPRSAHDVRAGAQRPPEVTANQLHTAGRGIEYVVSG